METAVFCSIRTLDNIGRGDDILFALLISTVSLVLLVIYIPHEVRTTSDMLARDGRDDSPWEGQHALADMWQNVHQRN